MAFLKRFFERLLGVMPPPDPDPAMQAAAAQAAGNEFQRAVALAVHQDGAENAEPGSALITPEQSTSSGLLIVHTGMVKEGEILHVLTVVSTSGRHDKEDIGVVAQLAQQVLGTPNAEVEILEDPMRVMVSFLLLRDEERLLQERMRTILTRTAPN